MIFGKKLLEFWSTIKTEFKLTMLSFEKYFVMESNKFNMAWQLVRVKARKIKDPQDKLEFVLDFLRQHPNAHNFDRVLNWIKMTAVGYQSKMPEVARSYEQAASVLGSNKEDYASTEDTAADLADYSREELQAVYDDLKKRKYGFQYKSVPKSHTEFLKRLEDALGI